MNKIQALANEMKQFFSPQTVTNVYSICEQLEIEIVEALIQADAYFECENGNRKEIFMSKIPTYTEKAIKKYDAKFDRVSILLPKGTKERIKALAGKSVSSFVSQAVTAELDRIESHS
jgi:hypothetical protein